MSAQLPRAHAAGLPLPPPPEHAAVASPNTQHSEMQARYMHGGVKLVVRRKQIELGARWCTLPRICVGCCHQLGGCCRALRRCACCVACGQTIRGWCDRIQECCHGCRRCECPEWWYGCTWRKLCYLLSQPKLCLVKTAKAACTPCRLAASCCGSGSARLRACLGAAWGSVRRRVLGLEDDGWPLVNGRPVLASMEPGRTQEQALDPMLYFSR